MYKSIMPIVKPIETISKDIDKLKKDIAEIKVMVEFITNYIKTQEDTSKSGWFY